MPAGSITGLSCCAALIFGLPILSEDTASIERPADTDTTYRSVLNAVKAEGYEIVTSSPETGIVTETVVTGRYRQTGTHLKLTFISNGPNKTTVRVAVVAQHRYKALKTEPWSDPKPDAWGSQVEATKLQSALTK